MTQPAHVVVFDVNETLSDMSVMGGHFSDIGAPSHLAQTWFAGVLRDGFALTAAGTTEPFAALATNHLRALLRDQPLDRPLDSAVEHLMDALLGLDVHPDVPAGVRDLAARGLRLVTLSNGSAQVADRLLERAGIRSQFEKLLSVEQAGLWKPARRAYEYAAGECGVDVSRLLLVAVHPWDIDGAARAGASTAWINRSGGVYPDHFTAPTHEVAALDELGALLVEEGR
ncbi:MAG TPA: haloacid dehalogenase type II [Nocardioidaceae bacterium]|nr:haloacid dehalogenase type II [Nocardioidaceae bacterium]